MSAQTDDNRQHNFISQVSAQEKYVAS